MHLVEVRTSEIMQYNNHDRSNPLAPVIHRGCFHGYICYDAWSIGERLIFSVSSASCLDEPREFRLETQSKNKVYHSTLPGHSARRNRHRFRFLNARVCREPCGAIGQLARSPRKRSADRYCFC